MSTLRVGGNAQPGSIDQGVHAAIPGLLRCYEAALKAHPSLAGDVRIEMVVGAQGDVLPSPYIEHNWTTLHDAGMETCVLGVASASKFPPPVSGLVSVSVTYSFAMR